VLKIAPRTMQAPSTGSMRSFFWNLLMGCKKAIFLMMP
jgi:hypothetical protein